MFALLGTVLQVLVDLTSASPDAPLQSAYIIGSITRVVVIIALMAGTMACMHALRLNDLRLLQACVAGFLSFAATTSVISIVALVLAATSEPAASASFWGSTIFSAVTAPVYDWMGIRMFLLYRQRCERAASELPTANEFEIDAPPWRRALVAWLVTLTILAVVALLLLTSARADPVNFLITIG